MTRPFSLAFKQKIVKRLTGKNALNAFQLARETEIRQQSLSRWLQETRSLPVMASDKRTRPEWTVEQKAQILAEASKLIGEQLTAYLDRTGVKLAHVERWRVALEEDGLGSNAVAKRFRKLQRELARREKALAEAAALLMLKKNAREPLSGRGRRYRRAERGLILRAITTARFAGARLAPACRVAGISARTVERFWRQPDGEDRRHGPHHRPNSALTGVEQAQIVSVMTNSRYAHLPPRQRVPRLADEGLYLASESTIYRLQRRLGPCKRRRAISRTDVTRASMVHHAQLDTNRSGGRQPPEWAWGVSRPYLGDNYLDTHRCR